MFLMGWDERFARETDQYTGIQFLPDLMCYGVFLMCSNTVLSIIVGYILSFSRISNESGKSSVNSSIELLPLLLS